ncbi:L-aspartate oxidase [Calidifontibacter terrae]
MQIDRPVVIGSGLAGLATAWALSPQRCILLTPGRITEQAASMWAQGGIAAALSADDSPELHAADTLRAGAYAGDTRAIARITDAAPDTVRLLDELGVPFDRAADGSYDLALEGGHSRSRVAHAGDSSGATVTGTLAGIVAALPSVDLREGHRVVDLVTEGGRVTGLLVAGPDDDIYRLSTSRVVLATGGMGGLWPTTTNPAQALGQGVALAARAGARTDDLHLVQFHPTALDVDADPNPLLTEALRGAGALLLADGERFVEELQPRDVVAAAVWEKLQEGRAVRLDVRAIPQVRERFTTVAASCDRFGFDIAHDLLPVRPALHYAMGGVTTDARARTSVAGLWAVGEVSRTGLHGANRLASNSLLEAVVTGRAAALDLATADVRRWSADVLPVDPATVVPRSIDPNPLARSEIRRLIGGSCGVIRDGSALEHVVDTLSAHRGDDTAYATWLVARSALLHPHSVGAHRRADDPALVSELEVASA